MYRTIRLLFAFWVLSSTSVHATHIIGGFVDYQYLGNNQYQITLKVYRDCFGGQAAFDNPANVAIFDGNGGFVRSIAINNPTITKIQPTLSNPCLVIPPQVCVEEGVYVTTVTLPPNATGYYFTYQRCCRNNTIKNIPNPGNQGATYFAFIPPDTVASGNSSPVFKEFPPVAICVGEPLVVDQSATDADGDSLSYTLCASYDGGSTSNPAPNPPNPPPYNKIQFLPPFSPTDPMDANPKLTIDPVTGLLTATPTIAGQYVVGVCINEYRNGVLINTYTRDFQFNVLVCPDVAVIEPLPDTSVLCAPFTITFGNNSNNANSYFWNFGDPTTNQDTSSLFEPTWTYPSTGTYTVTLYAENDDGCRDTTTQIVNITQAATADFDYLKVCPGEPVQFLDSSTTRIGPFISWSWDFGDGTTSTQQNPMHTYNGNGPFQVRLTAVTSDSCVVQRTRVVTFYPLPVARFSAGVRCVGLPINFTDKSTVTGSNTIDQWSWNFGDGNTAAVQNPTHTYSAPGNYIVQLIVTTDKGCKDTLQKTINVAGKPVAIADGDTAVCFNQPVQLRASGGQNYQWFPAAGLSNPNIANPIARPQQNTVYTVVVSDSCFSDTAFVEVKLLPIPTANFSFINACVGDTILFTDQSVDSAGLNIVNWQWDFDGNGGSSQQNPAFVFNGNGPYNVSLTVTNDTGCVSTISQTIAPFTLPDVYFTIDTPPCLNLPTLFTDRSTTDSGVVVARSWDFGDGNSAGNLITTQNTYNLPGQYTVTLMATTDKGCTDSVKRTLTIRTKTVATVNQPGPICPDDSAQLQAGGGFFYQWLPATGLSSDTVANPKASPNITTTYTVVVSDSCYADTATVTLTVHPKPQAAFSFTDDCVNDTTFFTDQSISNNSTLTAWDWNLGDGTTSQNQHPFHVFQANGTYNVTLIVTNNFTCRDTLTQAVTPYPVADSDFGYDSLVCLGDPIQFTDSSTLVTGSITAWKWTFGDGSAGAMQQNPQHSYNLPGTYQVQLITTTNNNCQDTVTKTIVIAPDVTAAASGDTAICSLDVVQLTAAGGLYYSWAPEEVLLDGKDSATVTARPLESPTIFTVTVADDCSADTATVRVDLLPWPEVAAAYDTTIYKGETATLEAIVDNQVVAFAWSPTQTIEPPYLPGDQTIEVRPDTIKWYTVEVTDIFGCTNKDSALVDFLDPFLRLPNAFSPNGDGLNDVFYAITRGEMELLNFSIYNRWGQRIYQTNGLATPSNGWDGTFKGVDQPGGVYTYVIKYRPVLLPGEVALKSGNVTLIR